MKKLLLSIFILTFSLLLFAQNETDLKVKSKSVQNMPLFEEFTSSTCPPCASFNTNVFTPFMNAHPDDITVIKYQMSWPAPGDPYYTVEGGVRRSFYGVNSVPDLYVGGVKTETNSAAVNDAYDFEMAKPSFFIINATHQINGNFITIQTDILPENDSENLTVHMVVIEKLTTGNVGNNGETEFKHVMMKMLPGPAGTTIDMHSNVHSYLSETFDMSSTYVEEMNDLGVVVFIQDNSKEVLQSAYSVEASLPVPDVTFLPTNGAADIDFQSEISLSFNQYMRLVDNSEITNTDISGFVSITDPSKADIPFTATINDSKSVITISPDTYYPELSLITVSIDNDEIEGINDVPMAGISSTFTTPEFPLPAVSFFPENGTADINYDVDVVLTFDMAMRHSDNSEITNNDIQNFVTVTDPSKGNIAFTATINPEKTIINITPDEFWPELTDITVTVLDGMIENIYDLALNETFTTFTTVEYPLANVVFDPFDGEDNVSISTNINLFFDNAMRMLDDSEITADNISSFISITDPTKGDIAFTGIITSSKALIILNPDDDLLGMTEITVTIDGDAIENEVGNPLSESSATFTTENTDDISSLFNDINIYPNPAFSTAIISNAANSNISITDVFGKSVLKQFIHSNSEEINIRNLSSGLYIINIELKGYESERKLIIVK